MYPKILLWKLNHTQSFISKKKTKIKHANKASDTYLYRFVCDLPFKFAYIYAKNLILLFV